MRNAILLLTMLIFLAALPRQAHADIAVQKLFTFEQLGFEEDRETTGISSTLKYNFSVPKSWSDVGLTLDLFYSHSNLLSDRLSHMTVHFNGVPIESVQMVREEAFGNELKIEVPAILVKGHQHELTLEFFMRMYEEACLDSGQQPGLWTVIHASSAIGISAEEQKHDLAWLPEPFTPHNLRENGRSALTVVLPEQPISTEINAAARVLSKLGQKGGSRDIEPNVVFGEVPSTGDVLIVARGDRLNQLYDTGELPLVWRAGQFERQRSGIRIDEAFGIVQLITRDDQSGLLIVSGAGADGLARASSALADDASLNLMAGDHAVIENLPLPAFPTPVVPAWSTLEQLTGFGDQRIEGIVIEEAKYCFFLPLEQQVAATATLSLEFHHSIALWGDRSSLEIRFNEKTFASASLDKPDGVGTILVEIPESFFEDGFNCFEFEFTLRMEPSDCNVGYSNEAWASISAESLIHIPLTDERVTNWLPNMAQYTYPFNLDSDLNHTWLILPDEPTPAETAGAMRLALRLGADARHPQLRLHAGVGKELDKSQYEDAHIILIGHPDRNTVAKAIKSQLELAPGNENTLTVRDRVLLSHINGAPTSAAEMLASPWDVRRAVLWINGEDELSLNNMFELLHTNPNEERLNGNIISISRDGAIGSVDTYLREEYLDIPTVEESGVVVQTEIEEPAAIRTFVVAGVVAMSSVIGIILLVSVGQWMIKRRAKNREALEEAAAVVAVEAEPADEIYSDELRHELAMLVLDDMRSAESVLEEYAIDEAELNRWMEDAIEAATDEQAGEDDE